METCQAEYRPLIISHGKGVGLASLLLDAAGLSNRVDVLDIVQFLTANIFERSRFKSADASTTLKQLIQRYNSIVSECETDPSLQVRLPD